MLREGQLFGDSGLWAGKGLYRATPAVRKDLGFEVSFEGLSLFTYLFEALTQILIMRYMTQRFIEVFFAQVCVYQSLCKFAERKHPLNFIFISQWSPMNTGIFVYHLPLSPSFSRFLFKVDQLVTQYILRFFFTPVINGCNRLKASLFRYWLLIRYSIHIFDFNRSCYLRKKSNLYMIYDFSARKKPTSFIHNGSESVGLIYNMSYSGKFNKSSTVSRHYNDFFQ